MLRRAVAVPLRRAAHSGGTVILEGPPSAGKTALLRSEFPKFVYVSMRDARDRSRARRSPSEFAARLTTPAIVDDIHLTPELARSLSTLPRRRPLIMASSRKLALPVTTLRLYRPTLAELTGRQPVAMKMLGHFVPAQSVKIAARIPWPTDSGSIEAAVQGLLQLQDLDRFYDFIEIAALASGQVLDVQKLARLAGTSRTTAVRWLSVLEACFLVIRIRPFDLDFGRRTVRSPKLHFLESDVFESRVVSELYRNTEHADSPADLRYWRDSNGLEIPLIYHAPGAPPTAIGIEESPNPVDLARLQRWMKLAGACSAAMISAQSSDARRGPVLGYNLESL